MAQAGIASRRKCEEIIQAGRVTVDGKVVTEASLGDELEVHLKLRSVNVGSLSNVAIVDLMPGGFDVVEADNGHVRGNPNLPAKQLVHGAYRLELAGVEGVLVELLQGGVVIDSQNTVRSEIAACSHVST